MADSTPHALLLEDEPLISMDLEMVLRAEGYDVSVTPSCAEASDWLDSHTPDVVIVDIELRDGICSDVVARLVEARIPFVVHSGDQRSFHVDTPFARGTWVEKPAAPDELIEAVRAALGGKEGITRLRARDATDRCVSTPL